MAVVTNAVSGVAVHRWRKYLSTNSTSTTALAKPSSVIAKPSNYIQLDQHAGARGLAVMPVGVGADDTNFHFAVVGWKKVEVTESSGSTKGVYEYRGEIIWAGLATMSTLTGVSGGLGTSTRYADTLAAVTAIDTNLDLLSGLTAIIYSPGSNGGEATLFIEDVTHVWDGITFLFDIDAGGAAVTSANLLWTRIQ